MPGRKPDFRLCFVEEVKGKKVWHRIGAGWKNDDSNSIGIQVNAGLPVTLPPNTKLVLVENTDNNGGEDDFPPQQ